MFKRFKTVRRVSAIVAGVFVGLYFFVMAFAHGSVESLWFEYWKTATLIFSFGVVLNLVGSDSKWPALCVGMPLVSLSFFILFGDIHHSSGSFQWQLSGFRLVVSSAAVLLAVLFSRFIAKAICVQDPKGADQ